MESTFRETLRSELDFQDIKVKELAVQTGISQRTLEGYLGARGSMPPADVAVKIARVLNVSVEYLVTGKVFQNIPKSRNETVGHLESMISGLSIEKKRLVKEFIGILQGFEVNQENQADIK